MSTNFRSSTPPEGSLDGRGLRIAIVCGRFNDLITNRLLDGVLATLGEHGVVDEDRLVVWVPGAFEIPLAAKTLALTGSWDAVVTVGAVIRGDTAHFDFVAGECARGIQLAQLDVGVPIIFGVLTTENLHQAMIRSGDSHNVGSESARTAIEMVHLLRQIGQIREDSGTDVPG